MNNGHFLTFEIFQLNNEVSRCNDEGITALHNSICAGHYDIVRFLVENNADVNAQVLVVFIS